MVRTGFIVVFGLLDSSKEENNEVRAWGFYKPGLSSQHYCSLGDYGLVLGMLAVFVTSLD
jgi:hypothetical protein